MVDFIQTLCLYAGEKINRHWGLAVAFHAVHAGCFSFGVKLWSLLKLKFSFMRWSTGPGRLKVLLLLAHYSPSLFPLDVFGDRKRSWGSCWHWRKYDNHKKRDAVPKCRQPRARLAIILKAVTPPGTWGNLYKKSVYHLHPYLAVLVYFFLSNQKNKMLLLKCLLWKWRP